MNILVTGGAGYIGSHTCTLLLEAGHHVIVLDNLSNSKQQSLQRIEKLTGKTLRFIQGDIRDASILHTVFTENVIDAVIHFAGLKAVGESVAKPLDYYENNVTGSLCLLQAMNHANTKHIVFSSSAAVYGDPASVPVREDSLLQPTNPYGASKLHIEGMLRDLHTSDSDWRIAILRYFNPCGAHPSGQIGEDPSDIPNNLMPFITQVAIGKRQQLSVFGNDYPTHDGTGVRDYIHVMDLAAGHIAALDALQNHSMITCNLGTGQGYSVLDIVQAFEKASGCHIPYQITTRRPGDIAQCYANPNLAKQLLNWQAKKKLQDMCTDHWHWQQKNPEGYT